LNYCELKLGQFMPPDTLKLKILGFRLILGI
jgi:hypothetical protein